jgi:TRAP transporter TAXI family solute receptor
MTSRARRSIARQVVIWTLGVVLAVAAAGVAAAGELGLITGRQTGTYFRFGHDLKRLVRPSGIDVVVHPSNGALDNLFAVSRRGGIHLGIVQSDILTFVADQHANPSLARIARNVHMVFPLFSEEVHVLGRRDIGDFEQLAGKRVAIGRVGSGTYLTARWLFKLADVVPGEMVPLDGADALAQLKAGQIDALVYVAAVPIGMLQRLKTDDGLALIPIMSSRIRETYAAAEIPGDAYAWQRTPVPTVAVKAVLVSSDLDEQNCALVGRFAQQVAAGHQWLVQHGHPAWKQVKFDNPWQEHECVRNSGRADSPAAGIRERNPVGDAIKDTLDGN